MLNEGCELQNIVIEWIFVMKIVNVENVVFEWKFLNSNINEQWMNAPYFCNENCITAKLCFEFFVMKIVTL